MSWDIRFLQNEFPTDARRDSELAGDEDTDKEVGTGPIVVRSPLKVTRKESLSPSSPGTVSWGPGQPPASVGQGLTMRAAQDLGSADAKSELILSVDHAWVMLISF